MLRVSSKKAPTKLADGTYVGDSSRPYALSVLAVDAAMLAKAIAEKAAAEASEAKVMARGKDANAIDNLAEFIGKVGRDLGRFGFN